MAFAFNDNEKFSLLAVDNCFSDIEVEVELPSGTWILPKMPGDVGDQWTRWIGEIRAERLARADLIIVRRRTSSNPGILDDEHNELFQQVLDIWSALQLSGIVFYEDASALQGSIENGQFDIRQMVHVDFFYQTKHAPQIPVTLLRLTEAVEIARVWRELVESGQYQRLIRGANILRDGYTHQYGEDRIHQFVRAMEGLIKPPIYGTTKEFKKRPQTFGGNNSATEKVLYESYEMRCDVEHVHAGDRFLRKTYAEDQIEAMGALRTRQMEVLTRESYRRILTNAEIRNHFETEDTVDVFWSMDEDQRRVTWGDAIDVTGFKDDDQEQEKIRQLREKYPP